MLGKYNQEIVIFLLAYGEIEYLGVELEKRFHFECQFGLKPGYGFICCNINRLFAS